MIYKNGAKEIAAQDGMAITFMAKFDEREGNSCHVHLSVARRPTARRVFAEQPKVFESFVAGQLAGLREITLFLAPNVNSYKRYAEGSFAPTAVAWGRDNRTCALRVVGHGAALRVENRVAGRRRQPVPRARGHDRRGPGRHRRSELALEPAFEGNAYTADKPRVPATLREARDRFAASGRRARRAFGDDVVEHYLNTRAWSSRVRGRRDRLGALPGVRAPVSLTVVEPATEAVLAELPRAGAEEADAAVARAKAALPAGGRSRRRPLAAAAPAGRRARLPARARWPCIEARNAGKPIGDARGSMGIVGRRRPATTPAPPAPTSATPSRSAAAWRSPSASRSASSR